MVNPDYLKITDGKWLNVTEYQDNKWIQEYAILQYYEMFEKGDS